VAAWVPDMFCDFYFVKNHENAKTLTTSENREKINTFGILRILEIF
jgi:hypothetical protein